MLFIRLLFHLAWKKLSGHGIYPMTILNFLMREFNNKGVTPRAMLEVLEEVYKGLWRAPKTWMTVDDHKAWQETLTMTRRIVSLEIGINHLEDKLYGEHEQ